VQRKRTGKERVVPREVPKFPIRSQEEEQLMSPFGFLPPFGVNTELQLREARARARMLREEWRLANANRTQGRGPGIIDRSRSRVGRSIVRLGERLAAPEVRAPRARMSTPRTETGC